MDTKVSYSLLLVYIFYKILVHVFMHLFLLSECRFGSMMSHHFVALELVLQSKSATEDKTFAINKHRMYNSCVLQLLKAIARFDESEFNVNKSWVIPALSQLILCDDRNVRMYVSQIYNDHVNELLLRK